ncbi:MAG TPA: mitofilin family membrane protein, partial [Magnetovibrio sp.]
MTDSADKPSLEEIAKADPAAPKAEDAVMSDATDAPEEKTSGSNAVVWLVMMLVVLGGATVTGWSYIGPYVEPTVSDLRAMMGLNPRPTEPRLPSELHAEAAPQATPAESMATESSTPETTPVQSMAQEAVDEATQPEITEPKAVTSSDAIAAPDALAARIEAMQGQLDALGKMLGPESQANLNAIGGVVRALEDVNRELVSLSARLQAVEEQTRADPTAPAQALVLGMTQLRARLMGDGPFAAELAALEQIAAGDAAVAAAVAHLRPHADVGIPSEAVLTARFDKVAKAIIAARTTSEADGWLGAVKDRL